MRAKSNLSNLSVLSFFCFIALLFSVSPLLGQQDLRESLVRVYLNRDYPGVVHGSRYIPHIHVQEVAELQGVVFDSRGYIVSFVGSYWPELSRPGGDARLSIETFDGKRHPARLVGVDERVALVVLESEELKGKALSFREGLDESEVHFVSFHEEEWRVVSPAVVKVSGDDPSPVRELQIVPNGMDHCPVEGGLVLGAENQLAGIVRRSHSHPFSSKIQVWQVFPSQVIQSSVNRIVETRENIRAGWLGIMPDFNTSDLRVARVIPESPAETADVQNGDVIVAIDGQTILSRRDLAQTIRWKGSGSRLTISILRDGQPHELSTVLSERQDRGPRVSWRLEVPAFWNRTKSLEEQVEVYRTILPSYLNLGLVVDPLTPTLAEYFKQRARYGLLIRTVLPDSPAGQVGFQEGDVVVEVNGRSVASDMDIQRSFQSDDGVMMIRFLRDGRSMTRRITLP
jgi:serine protease Do